MRVVDCEMSRYDKDAPAGACPAGTTCAALASVTPRATLPTRTARKPIVRDGGIWARESRVSDSNATFTAAPTDTAGTTKTSPSTPCGIQAKVHLGEVDRPVQRIDCTSITGPGIASLTASAAGATDATTLRWLESGLEIAVRFPVSGISVSARPAVSARTAVTAVAADGHIRRQGGTGQGEGPQREVNRTAVASRSVASLAAHSAGATIGANGSTWNGGAAVSPAPPMA